MGTTACMKFGLWEDRDKDSLVWWAKIKVLGQNPEHYVWWTQEPAHHLANTIPMLTGRNWEKDERCQIQRSHWRRPENGGTVNLSAGQWPEANNKDNAGLASGSVSDSPWVVQPKPRLKSHRTSAKTPEDDSSQTLLIQSDGAWEDQSPVCKLEHFWF